MAILSVSELQEHVQTDLGTDAIQRLADASEEIIDDTDGGSAAVTEYFDEDGYPLGRSRKLWTENRIGSITSITERDTPDDDATTLSADDYRQEGNRRLVRLRDGTNPRRYWAPHVAVTFTPAAASNTRKTVQIELVKYMVAYNGAQRYGDGDFDIWQADHGKEIRAILAPLQQTRMEVR